MTLPKFFYFTSYFTVYNSDQAETWTRELMVTKETSSLCISEALFEYQLNGLQDPYPLHSKFTYSLQGPEPQFPIFWIKILNASVTDSPKYFFWQLVLIDYLNN